MARWLIATSLSVFLLAGCIGGDNETAVRKVLATCAENASQSDCENAAFLVLDPHARAEPGATRPRLGFIEFDDLGFRHYPPAVNHVFREIAMLNSGDMPLLVVMFIHGWHHNAGPDDTNVASFRQFLVDLQYEEELAIVGATRRQVVGVYVGWRGESDESILNPLTYRSRKNAGLRVGQYGLQEVLAELSKVRASNNRNRLVAVGHSFGGGVLYSSVLQNLVDKVVSADAALPGSEGRKSLTTIGKAYGDLVILMNPALEAARAETLHRRLSNANFAECQPLVLASFTSEYDTALSEAFPKGQALFFRDDVTVAKNGDLVTTAYGRSDTYRTHELSCDECAYSLSSGESFLTLEQFSNAARGWDAFRTDRAQVFQVDQMRMNHVANSTLQPGTPIMNVFVKGDNLIQDHNAIWGEDFLRFVRALIGMEFAKISRC